MTFYKHSHDLSKRMYTQDTGLYKSLVSELSHQSHTLAADNTFPQEGPQDDIFLAASPIQDI